MADMVSDRPDGSEEDLARSPSIIWLWGVPIAIIITGSVLNGVHVLSLTSAGIMWTIATLWIGIGCVINAWHCGRVHCLIDGVLFPLLSLVGLLNVLGIVSLNWNAYWAIFLVILGLSFVPELVWKKYA